MKKNKLKLRKVNTIDGEQISGIVGSILLMFLSAWGFVILDSIANSYIKFLIMPLAYFPLAMGITFVYDILKDIRVYWEEF